LCESVVERATKKTRDVIALKLTSTHEGDDIREQGHMRIQGEKANLEHNNLSVLQAFAGATEALKLRSLKIELYKIRPFRQRLAYERIKRG
jgi:hypothetical protein